MLQTILTIALACAVGAEATQITSVCSEAPTVTLASGILIGTTSRLAGTATPVNQFLGVPFADSPPCRFKPPEPPKSWSEPKHVNKRSDTCIQKFNYPEDAREFSMAVYNEVALGPPTESEDCLYLNVFAPGSPAPYGGRTVMVWVFGGGFDFGSANLHSYDGTSFAANQDVVIVAANYRTNVFGGPGAPQLAKGENNVGLLDQRLALQWVQENIDKFGGDPKKVTVFGESAGATFIDNFITAYTTESAPFRAAIMQSGQDTFGPLRANKGNSTAWDELVQALDCGSDPASQESFDCVQQAPADKIKSIAEHQMLSFLPFTDGGVTVADDPLEERQAGNFAKVPVLFGTNSQEGRVFDVGKSNLTGFVENMTGPAPMELQTILEAYPVNPPDTEYDVISEVTTDYLFTCSAQGYQNVSIAGGVPAWRYYYNASFPNTNPVPSMPLGVYHSSEIYLVFGTYNETTATDQEVKLSAFMQKAWADFAKNPTQGPGWSQVNQPAISVAALGSNGSTGATIFDPRSNVDVRCAAFNALYNYEQTLMGPGL